IVMSRNEYNLDLTEKMLWSWHSSLLAHDKNIAKGAWRTHKEPMQIISGTYGKENVHFEAPPSSKLSKEMKNYIKWFNLSRKEIKNPIIRSAIAHLYFESIHPFEDGNGRIGRIISEKVLSQALGQPILISLSNSIEKHRYQYYSELKENQRKLTIDKWIIFFGEMIIDAQKNMLQTIEFTIKKTKFLDYAKPLMDTKQQKAINKMLQDENFIGGMNASKYMSITKVSKATATRDLADLVSKNILVSEGGGRSTTYVVCWEKN
ncbi:MAG: Fic family protein, partial [Chitinophagales bacterium]